MSEHKESPASAGDGDVHTSTKLEAQALESSAHTPGERSDPQSVPYEPSQNNATHGNSLVDPIAELMGAQTFNIADHRVDDFRQAASSEAAKGITFGVGKPGGTMQGVAVLTKKAVHIQANLVVWKTGKTTHFARPTSEFLELEMRGFLERVHLVPVIDVTGPVPAGLLWPFRITAWDGYEKVFNALTELNDEEDGIFLRYSRGGGNDAGGYSAEPFPMEARHRSIVKDVTWPAASEVQLLVQPIPFSDLLQQNFIMKRAWQQVLNRRGQA